MKIKLAIEGRYKLETFKSDSSGRELPGSRRTVAPWFKNLITDAGLERMGATPDWMQYCRVGSGSTPPTVADTTLASLVASTSTPVSNVSGAQPSAPYFGWSRKTFQFAEGVAAGNLSEVGVGWFTGNSLFSRALILDPGGNPTTISVGSDELLEVTYEIRIFVPATDNTGVVNISGVDYSWTARAANATNSIYWSASTNGAFVNQTTATAYTGTIGPVTGSPSGTGSGLSLSRGSYSSGSKKIAMTIKASLTQGNVVGGIKSIGTNGGTGFLGSYQLEFDPVIPKTNTQVFSLTYEVAWDRQP